MGARRRSPQDRRAALGTTALSRPATQRLPAAARRWRGQQGWRRERRDTRARAARCGTLPRLRLRGLMCMPPAETEVARQRQWFRETRQVFDYLNEHGFGLDTLSMGTSADFEAAIAEGVDAGAHRHRHLRTAPTQPRRIEDTSPSMNITAAFIGGGNMGGALIRGLIARGLPRAGISVGEAVQARRVAARRRTRRARIGRQSRDRRRRGPRGARREAAGHGQDGAAAGRRARAAQRRWCCRSPRGFASRTSQGWCGPGIAVVRAMPNRPALNNAGATAMLRAGRTRACATQAAQRMRSAPSAPPCG